MDIGLRVWRGGWDLHPWLAGSILGLFVLYLVGAWLVGSRSGERLSVGRFALFTLGIAALFATLHSPLHHLADDYLFSAHMAQHQLLTLVIPPLLLLGTPEWLLRPLLDHAMIRSLGSSRLYPVVAFALFNILFAFAHFPSVYDALFSSELPHRLAHVAFLIAATIGWLPIASPIPSVIPRLTQPGQMLYCFLQCIPGSLVGALITLSDRIVYRHYGARPMELGVAPLADQQLGGLLMWVVSGTFYLVVLTVIFFAWADREEATAYGG
ncbi:MAG: Cytochrome c oxidase caa3-type, assembly factor CtaG-related protein [Chloroflexi bacterium]|nr:Cytochrome c oxidase caa3-type, assembly factor CtaG-related protein [Chloroflexota bacterium]